MKPSPYISPEEWQEQIKRLAEEYQKEVREKLEREVENEKHSKELSNR